jgi:hypothetical protein
LRSIKDISTGRMVTGAQASHSHFNLKFISSNFQTKLVLQSCMASHDTFRYSLMSFWVNSDLLNKK